MSCEDSLRFSRSYRVALLASGGHRLSHLLRLVLPGHYFSFSNSALTFCFWSFVVAWMLSANATIDTLREFVRLLRLAVADGLERLVSLDSISVR
jgi:hypothetical protein